MGSGVITFQSMLRTAKRLFSFRNSLHHLELTFDQLVLDLDGEPVQFRFRGRTTAVLAGATESIRWLRLRLQDSRTEREVSLERYDDGLLLFEKTGTSLSGIVCGGHELTMKSLERILSESDGSTVSIVKNGKEYRYRFAAPVLVSDEGERFRFLFEAIPKVLIIEIYKDQLDTFAQFEGRFLPISAIVGAWRERIRR